MNGGTACPAIESSDDVNPRIAVGIAGRSLSANELDAKAALLQPLADVFGARPVGVAGRVHRWKADQVRRKRGEVIGSVFDGFGKALVHAPN